MSKEQGSTWKLGLFVVLGLILFAATIYYVGKHKNIFGTTFHLTARFKSAGGLKEGNNIRLSGINVGTVKSITLKDSFVLVDLVLEKKVNEFIKTDAYASIGSDGLMGDKLLTISQGGNDAGPVKDGDVIATKNAIDMEDIMASLKTNVDNAGVITAQLAEFTYKINNGTGILSKVIGDPKMSMSLETTLSNLQNSSKEFSQFAKSMNNEDGALATMVSNPEFSGKIKQTMSNLEKSSNEFATFSAKLNDENGSLSRLTGEKTGNTLDSTMYNIQQATKKLDENMEALQHNFLLKGYFKKKAKADAKKAEELRKVAAASQPVVIPVVEIKDKKQGY